MAIHQMPSSRDGVITDQSNALPRLSMQGLKRLTVRSRRRLEFCESKAAAVLDVSPTRSRLQTDLDNALSAKSSYIARCKAQGVVPDESEIARLDADIMRARNALETFDSQMAPLMATGRIWQGLNADNIRLANMARADFSDVQVKVPGDATVDGSTAELAEINQQVRETESATLPVDLAIARMRDEISRDAIHGAPVAQVIEKLNGRDARAKLIPDVEIRWPEKAFNAEPAIGDELVNAIDVTALFCWAFEDQIKTKLEADLEKAYRDFTGLALGPEEKRVRLRDLSSRRLAVERILAELIWARLEAGEDDVFPPGIDPRAVLGVV